ncbi:MAG: phosphatase PAP2 family protein [Chitinophagaceae bacterium]|nr:phosphatase PAP2 family protein [Chitinophagaceae bacterium]
MAYSRTFLKVLLLVCCCSGTAAAQDTCAPIADRRPNFTAQQLVAPVLLAGAGLTLSGHLKYEVQDWRNRHFSSFHTKADDVLAVAPIAVVYGLDLLGVEARTDFVNRSVILAKAELLAIGSVYLLKAGTREMRPDGSDFHSFPSNHSAQAFLAATLLSTEYGRRYRWMPYAAYTMASAVGALRVLNNKHYLNDVLVGAGIGILSQKLAYWTHRYQWGARKQKAPLDF